MGRPRTDPDQANQAITLERLRQLALGSGFAGQSDADLVAFFDAALRELAASRQTLGAIEGLLRGGQTRLSRRLDPDRSSSRGPNGVL